GARAGDEEPLYRDGGSRRGAAAPGRAHRVVLDRGHEHAVVPGGVLLQERLLLGDRAGRQRGVLAARAEVLRGCADVTGEHLVPHGVGPAVQVAVPDDELLLAAVQHGAAGELRVGDEATAGEAWRRAVVHQREEPVDG